MQLQTETPIQPFALWLVCLYNVTSEQTGLDFHKIKINTQEAHKWWADGFTPYVTFRETYSS